MMSPNSSDSMLKCSDSTMNEVMADSESIPVSIKVRVDVVVCSPSGETVLYVV